MMSRKNFDHWCKVIHEIGYLYKHRLALKKTISNKDEGLTLETSAFKLFTEANLLFQLS